MLVAQVAAHDGFYFEATRVETSVQLERLGAALGEHLGVGRLALRDWEEAVGRLVHLGAERELPVVLDEFGHIIEADRSADSVLSSMFGPGARRDGTGVGMARVVLCVRVQVDELDGDAHAAIGCAVRALDLTSKIDTVDAPGRGDEAQFEWRENVAEGQAVEREFRSALGEVKEVRVTPTGCGKVIEAVARKPICRDSVARCGPVRFRWNQRSSGQSTRTSPNFGVGMRPSTHPHWAPG